MTLTQETKHGRNDRYATGCSQILSFYTDRALHGKSSVKSNVKQDICCGFFKGKKNNKLTWLSLPSEKYRIKRTVTWQIPLSWTKA